MISEWNLKRGEGGLLSREYERKHLCKGLMWSCDCFYLRYWWCCDYFSSRWSMVSAWNVKQCESRHLHWTNVKYFQWVHLWGWETFAFEMLATGQSLLELLTMALKSKLKRWRLWISLDNRKELSFFRFTYDADK